MMHSMHVGRHHDEAKDAVDRLWNMDVAVVEHGGGVESHLEDEHGEGRGSEGCDGHELDAHGENDLDGMEAHSRGHVKIEVRVVDHVYSPKDRNGMVKHMLQVYRKIKNEYSNDNL